MQPDGGLSQIVSARRACRPTTLDMGASRQHRRSENRLQQGFELIAVQWATWPVGRTVDPVANECAKACFRLRNHFEQSSPSLNLFIRGIIYDRRRFFLAMTSVDPLIFVGYVANLRKLDAPTSKAVLD